MLQMVVKCLFALILCIFMYAPTVQAQQALPWPETFRGSPEFEFNRQTLINKENQGVKVERGVGRTAVKQEEYGTIESLMKSSIFNFYAVLNQKKKTAQTNANAQNSIEDDLIQIDLPNLPVFGFNAVISLSDFEKQLLSIVEDPASYRIKYDEKSLETELKDVVIQSMNTSGNPYVTIKNKKLYIGDNFPLEVKVKDNTQDVIDRMNQLMPPRSELSEEQYLEYDTKRREMIKMYQERRKVRTGQVDETNAGLHKIYVVIRKINHQELDLRVQGNPYQISFNYKL